MKAESFFIAALAVLALTACKKDEPSSPVTPESSVTGFYLLNQGTMGSNKAVIDFYNYSTGVYTNDFWGSVNPTVTLGLGDTGNDMKTYGGKVYAAIMGSNLVEVMDAATGKHITAITVEKCRYLNYAGGKVYVTSYASANTENPDTNGSVMEIDTLSLSITRTCAVGPNPEEMAIVNGKMYVADSGGYLYPTYCDKLSVIDLQSFTEDKQITVALNMCRVRSTSDGKLYITSYGNYDDIAGNLTVFDPATEQVEKTFDVAVSGLDIRGTKCLCYSCSYDTQGKSTYNFYSIDTTTGIMNDGLITDGTASTIKNAYNIAIDPYNGNFYVCDATDYVSPGYLFCYSSDGKLQWKKQTGDVPCAIAFK